MTNDDDAKPDTELQDMTLSNAMSLSRSVRRRLRVHLVEINDHLEEVKRGANDTERMVKASDDLIVRLRQPITENECIELMEDFMDTLSETFRLRSESGGDDVLEGIAIIVRRMADDVEAHKPGSE